MKIYDIKSPEELLEFMNNNIRYGWLDNENNEHIDTMKQFRKLYRTLSLGEMLVNKLGTCIEQTYLEIIVMENLGIEYKAYCLRSYEDNPRIVEPKMHCFLIYTQKGKWYHFEHSNPEVRGIHEYNTEEEAMKDILTYYQKRDKGRTRQLLEIKEVPAGLSWQEWNTYLDELAKGEIKCL